MPVSVDLERCVGSRDCLSACAFNAIEVQNGKAVVFENCVDCDMCVRACPVEAIISSTAPAAAGGSTLIVDFGERSGIIVAVERAAKRIGASWLGARIEVANASAAADMLAAHVKENGYALIVLPQSGPGPAIAARLASLLGASLLANCAHVTFDESGGVRATRLRYGGIVKTVSRVGTGTTVITLVPRGPAPFAAEALESGATSPRSGDAPAQPPRRARTIVVVPATLPPQASMAARACALALGAPVLETKDLQGGDFAPELLVAIGVEGSTEENTAMRNAGVIVALISNDTVPIAQIADYIITGDVTESVQALLAAL